uniref:EGF-like domain-containing protein n=1 Tax=Ciona savignyi TaxID=51511 RepID=H2Z4B5_CIOSA
ILSIILYAMIFVACVGKCFNCIGIPCTEENNKFLCDNGNCIWHAWRCDKENDCKDNSDEVNCENKTCNVDEQFRCANGLCVSKRWLCDGDDDCKDNSDEDQVMCSNRTCNSTGQDFQCTLGKSCISSSWVCDGEDDCVDGSDELGCVQPTCLSTEYRCAQGGCITNRWRCDGELDCEDGSDESGCPPRNCSAKNEFRCSSHQQCIPLSWKCDKDPDCEDGSDEHNCPVKPTPICPSGYFSCEFGFPACIIKTWKCDGEEDCSGGSDEKNCSGVSCRNDQFACDNHHCIAQSLVCNGVRDCNDASDEHDCKGLTPKCDPVRMYQCKDGTCISKSRLCNHRHDCPNGEDEQEGFLKCNYNECLVNNGNCSDTCVDQRFGYQCQCSPGFQLNEDGRMCDDTNECLQKRSVCMEMAQCINYKGGYKCECYAGYQMERGRCKPTGDIEDSEFVTLVFSNKIDIRRLRVHSNLKTRFMTVIADQLKHAIGLSLNIKKRQVFWTDLRDENVLRTDTNNLKSVKTVLSNHEVRSPISLAVDWVNDHLYWVDYSLGTVSLAYSNGDFPTTLLTLKPMSLRSIAIHPEDGIMFLTVAKAGKWLIMKCAMDGTDCMDVITENIKEPTSITIDYQEQRLFWLDGKLNTMSSCDFDGGNRRTVLSVFNYLQHPFGISVGLNEVYWTDVMAHSVLKCNKWTGNNVTVIDSHLHFPMDIHVDHPTAQPEMQNHCIDNSCQFMCIPLPSGGAKRFTCVCP